MYESYLRLTYCCHVRELVSGYELPLDLACKLAEFPPELELALSSELALSPDIAPFRQILVGRWRSKEGSMWGSNP